MSNELQGMWRGAQPVFDITLRSIYTAFTAALSSNCAPVKNRHFPTEFRSLNPLYGRLSEPVPASRFSPDSSRVQEQGCGLVPHSPRPQRGSKKIAGGKRYSAQPPETANHPLSTPKGSQRLGKPCTSTSYLLPDPARLEESSLGSAVLSVTPRNCGASKYGWSALSLC